MPKPLSHRFHYLLIGLILGWIGLGLLEVPQVQSDQIVAAERVDEPVIPRQSRNPLAQSTQSIGQNAAQSPQDGLPKPKVALPTDLPTTRPQASYRPPERQLPAIVTSEPSAQPVNQKIHYEITGGGLDVRGETEGAGKRVAAVTQEIADKHQMSFRYEVSDLGWFVTEIGGVAQDPRKGFYWLFYVNGQLANRGADQVILEDGDTLTWKYESTL